jgi:hypothetical protein
MRINIHFKNWRIIACVPMATKNHLNETLSLLDGPTREQIIVCNQWAAVAFNLFHSGSAVSLILDSDGTVGRIDLEWDSAFSTSAMRERKKMAEEGGVALAFFVMSVLAGYRYLIQTEIGEGVDYCFFTEKPTSANFLQGGHYVEISGILEEKGSNNLPGRVENKHDQITRGTHRGEKCSVIVTLFKAPYTIKESHLWT